MNILINSFGTITSIPFINNAPDFGGYNDPTLSILQAAYAAGDYEIIDTEPVGESVVPNWDRLYDQLIVSNIYNYILLQSTQPQYASIAGVMTAFAAAIIVGKLEPSNPARFDAFQASVYGVLGTASALEMPIFPEQLAEVRTILDGNGFSSIQLQ